MIILGDCLTKLKTLDENSVDSIVTDPPYELGFMGKSWDNTGIANNSEMWAECLRVLKPGGHLLSFGGTRTYHRMAVAIEDAGFEIRDMINWCYGSGFPKSLNIGKAVDRLQGNERELLATETRYNEPSGIVGVGQGERTLIDRKITKGTSQWEGWGTALKPAHEPICMARKPLAEKTVAENVLKYGTGGINIDESRVGTEDNLAGGSGRVGGFAGKTEGGQLSDYRVEGNNLGRFPANLIHDNSEEVRECFPDARSNGNKTNDKSGHQNAYVGGVLEKQVSSSCYSDSGNASRFFKSIIYKSKASKRDRGEGNIHPTVKSVALMEYLIKMVTPKGGVVLDPFAGSGSTLVAAKQNGYKYIGIELTPEYIPIIEARLSFVEPTLFTHETSL